MNDFISGGISGICQTIIGHPLDTYKVLIQNNQFKMNQIYNINPYLGIKYPLYASVIICSITFGTNSYLKQNMNYDELVNGFISGTIISPIIFYFDYKKIHNQLKLKSYTNIWKRKGKFSCFLRESIAFSVYFKSYDMMHHKYKYNPLISGGVAGLVNWTVTYPIDTIKTRQTVHNMNFIDCVKLGNFWKGYLPCAFRAVMVNSTGFYVYQHAHNNYKNIFNE
mgnify:CR=1 FL=1